MVSMKKKIANPTSILTFIYLSVCWPDLNRLAQLSLKLVEMGTWADRGMRVNLKYPV